MENNEVKITAYQYQRLANNEIELEKSASSIIILLLEQWKRDNGDKYDSNGNLAKDHVGEIVLAVNTWLLKNPVQINGKKIQIWLNQSKLVLFWGISDCVTVDLARYFIFGKPQL